MLSLRIFRSPQANYYSDDILTGPAAYPEAYFARLVQNGFNAVWLRGILRDLAPSMVFPELEHDVARHQDALGLVVERAKAYGVSVLLYLNEPLCLPRAHPFWAEYPEVCGDSGSSGMDEWPETYALCTSTAQVRAWLREVTANLFRTLPELAGWFLISASEHHTHCYSHCFGSQMPSCPRLRGTAARRCGRRLDRGSARWHARGQFNRPLYRLELGVGGVHRSGPPGSIARTPAEGRERAGGLGTWGETQHAGWPGECHR